jgi:hypothetical protein
MLVGHSAKGSPCTSASLNLIAVSRSNKRFTERLRDIKLRPETSWRSRATSPFCPGASRNSASCRWPSATSRSAPRAGWIALSFSRSPSCPGVHLVPSRSRSSGRPLLLVLFGALPLREAYESIEWPIL